MIKYGFNVSNKITFIEEEKLALENGFSILQVWFDKNGLSLYEYDNVHTLEKSKVKTILHISATIIEIPKVLELALPVLRTLKHNEVIVHIIDGTVKEMFLEKIKNEMSNWISIFHENDITIYFENNSKLDNVFQTAEDIEDFFKTFPETEFLIDVAHIDNYEHLQKLIKIKKPKYLHLSDRHLESIHEHLTIGDGNIDFSKIFQQHIPNFNGTIIFEVPWSASSRKSSKTIIEKITLGEFYTEDN